MVIKLGITFGIGVIFCGCKDSTETTGSSDSCPGSLVYATTCSSETPTEKTCDFKSGLLPTNTAGVQCLSKSCGNDLPTSIPTTDCVSSCESVDGSVTASACVLSGSTWTCLGVGTGSFTCTGATKCTPTFGPSFVFASSCVDTSECGSGTCDTPSCDVSTQNIFGRCTRADILKDEWTCNEPGGFGYKCSTANVCTGDIFSNGLTFYTSNACQPLTKVKYYSCAATPSNGDKLSATTCSTTAVQFAQYDECYTAGGELYGCQRQLAAVKYYGCPIQPQVGDVLSSMGCTTTVTNWASYDQCYVQNGVAVSCVRQAAAVKLYSCSGSTADYAFVPASCVTTAPTAGAAYSFCYITSSNQLLGCVAQAAAVRYYGCTSTPATGATVLSMPSCSTTQASEGQAYHLCYVDSSSRFNGCTYQGAATKYYYCSANPQGTTYTTATASFGSGGRGCLTSGADGASYFNCYRSPSTDVLADCVTQPAAVKYYGCTGTPGVGVLVSVTSCTATVSFGASYNLCYVTSGGLFNGCILQPQAVRFYNCASQPAQDGSTSVVDNTCSKETPSVAGLSYYLCYVRNGKFLDCVSQAPADKYYSCAATPNNGDNVQVPCSLTPPTGTVGSPYVSCYVRDNKFYECVAQAAAVRYYGCGVQPQDGDSLGSTTCSTSLSVGSPMAAYNLCYNTGGKLYSCITQNAAEKFYGCTSAPTNGQADNANSCTRTVTYGAAYYLCYVRSGFLYDCEARGAAVRYYSCTTTPTDGQVVSGPCTTTGAAGDAYDLCYVSNGRFYDCQRQAAAVKYYSCSATPVNGAVLGTNGCSLTAPAAIVGPSYNTCYVRDGKFYDCVAQTEAKRYYSCGGAPPANGASAAVGSTSCTLILPVVGAQYDLCYVDSNQKFFGCVRQLAAIKFYGCSTITNGDSASLQDTSCTDEVTPGAAYNLCYVDSNNKFQDCVNQPVAVKYYSCVGTPNDGDTVASPCSTSAPVGTLGSPYVTCYVTSGKFYGCVAQASALRYYGCGVRPLDGDSLASTTCSTSLPLESPMAAYNLCYNTGGKLYSCITQIAAEKFYGCASAPSNGQADNANSCTRTVTYGAAYYLCYVRSGFLYDCESRDAAVRYYSCTTTPTNGQSVSGPCTTTGAAGDAYDLCYVSNGRFYDCQRQAAAVKYYNCGGSTPINGAVLGTCTSIPPAGIFGPSYNTCYVRDGKLYDCVAQAQAEKYYGCTSTPLDGDTSTVGVTLCSLTPTGLGDAYDLCYVDATNQEFFGCVGQAAATKFYGCASMPSNGDLVVTPCSSTGAPGSSYDLCYTKAGAFYDCTHFGNAIRYYGCGYTPVDGDSLGVCSTIGSFPASYNLCYNRGGKLYGCINYLEAVKYYSCAQTPSNGDSVSSTTCTNVAPSSTGAAYDLCYVQNGNFYECRRQNAAIRYYGCATAPVDGSSIPGSCSEQINVDGESYYSCYIDRLNKVNGCTLQASAVVYTGCASDPTDSTQTAATTHPISCTRQTTLSPSVSFYLCYEVGIYLRECVPRGAPVEFYGCGGTPNNGDSAAVPDTQCEDTTTLIGPDYDLCYVDSRERFQGCVYQSAAVRYYNCGGPSTPLDGTAASLPCTSAITPDAEYDLCYVRDNKLYGCVRQPAAIKYYGCQTSPAIGNQPQLPCTLSVTPFAAFYSCYIRNGEVSDTCTAQPAAVRYYGCTPTNGGTLPGSCTTSTTHMGAAYTTCYLDANGELFGCESQAAAIDFYNCGGTSPSYGSLGTCTQTFIPSYAMSEIIRCYDDGSNYFGCLTTDRYYGCTNVTPGISLISSGCSTTVVTDARFDRCFYYGGGLYDCTSQQAAISYFCSANPNGDSLRDNPKGCSSTNPSAYTAFTCYVTNDSNQYFFGCHL